LAELHYACFVDELRTNEPIVVGVDGKEVLIVRVDDEIFALRNICPHESASFLNGHVRPRLRSATPGEAIEADASDPLLFCPWHTWSFSLRDGRCPQDPSLRVLSYETVVEDGRVLIRPRRTSEAA
jgi:3-phenylpropionate/trans-cinnamate dioxygenase ferredoxin subunit